MKDPTANLAEYREFLDRQLCWVDGVPTHASSQLQRQCPKCRMKWSYGRFVLQIAVMEEFCLGSSASKAARKVGCVKNTALSYFLTFRRSMEEMIADQLLKGNIAINPLNLAECQSLEKALRSGSRRLRTKCCQHLFMSSLTFEERLRMIFQFQIVPEVKSRHAKAVKRLERHAEPVKPRVLYSPPARSFPPANLKPRKRFLKIVRKSRDALWRKRPALPDQNCPYPSRACEKLGRKWVRLWEKLHEFRADNTARDSPRN